VGLFDFLGGGSGPEKATKLKGKITQKYGDPLVRQKAMAQLGEMHIPEAATTLLARFTVSVEPQTTDADEKDHAFELICGMGEVAVPPVKEFLRRSDQATSWALRILEKLLPEDALVGLCVEELTRLGAEYSRDPEKKTVLIHFVEGKSDPRIAPALLPLLDDMSDDVKIAGLRALGPLRHEAAREPMLALLTGKDTARRVQVAAVAALEASGFGVQGYRERVEALLPEPYFVDRAGLVHKRT
jgi:hypothetical protein